MSPLWYTITSCDIYIHSSILKLYDHLNNQYFYIHDPHTLAHSNACHQIDILYTMMDLFAFFLLWLAYVAYVVAIKYRGRSCSSVVACWAAGQQVKRSILHLEHDSNQTSSHKPRLPWPSIALRWSTNRHVIDNAIIVTYIIWGFVILIDYVLKFVY